MDGIVSECWLYDAVLDCADGCRTERQSNRGEMGLIELSSHYEI